jgi:hypothetical protein
MNCIKVSALICISAMMLVCCLAASPSTQKADTRPADEHLIATLPSTQLMKAARIRFDHWIGMHPRVAIWWSSVVRAWQKRALQLQIASLKAANQELETQLNELNVILIGGRYGNSILSVPITEVARRRYSQALAKAGRDFESDLREVLSQARERKDEKTIHVLEGVFQRLSRSNQHPLGRVPAVQHTKVNEVIWNGHRYRIIREHTSWHNAKATCERLGGHLVSITSEGEQAMVAHLADGTKSAWIGATCEGHVGKWRWVTGEPWHYAYWRPGEPNNFAGTELFAEMSFQKNDHGRWNDNRFWTNARSPSAFICEWDSP